MRHTYKDTQTPSSLFDQKYPPVHSDGVHRIEAAVLFPDKGLTEAMTTDSTNQRLPECFNNTPKRKYFRSNNLQAGFVLTDPRVHISQDLRRLSFVFRTHRF